MLDFLKFGYEFINRESRITVQYASSTRVKDLMIRGGCFYAAWDFENEEWTQNICRVYELIDASIQEFVKSQMETLKMDEYEYRQRYKIPVATLSGSKIPENFIKYTKQVQDNFKPLNTKVVFKSDKAARELYSSKRLPYDPIEMETPAYDRLMSVLYSDSERQKIEWLIGAGLCRDNGKIQKFGVLYGEPGTGKGTVLDIIMMLFEGYTSAFEADALGHKSDSFALEPFKTNPVIAIQTDGNLSRIESNARLNTLISHETMTVNEKFKNKYTAKFDTILLMGTNNPVRITDAKSGLLRRLIDIEPTGNTIPKDEYDEIKEKLPFEISGIAYRCMELYSNNKKLYNAYRPMTMMSKTNEFYDFVLEYYDQFCAEDYILLSTAWTWYKKYVEDSNAYTKLSRRAFASELCAYFEEGQHDEWYVDEDGSRKHLSSVYRGFRRERFKNVRNRGIGEVKVVKSKKSSSGAGEGGSSDVAEESKADILKNLPKWLKLKDVSGMSDDDLMENPLNVYLKDAKAQYAVPTDTGGSKPKNSWDYTRSKLNAINTLREHYILTQSIDPRLICIDFDLKDPETGEKSLERNLLAAAKFPKTYAETSKSGKGLHLYYIYDGNVDDLSMLYDTEIEIKVFTGKSALRRMLYLCNTEEISHINSGLPLKEVKKMINWEGVQNEKHLRALIEKGLKKQVFPNTKPSIDYISHCLEEAYNSGVSYDVTDMRQKVLNMAYAATNQSEYCVEAVLKMKFNSPDKENVEDEELTEERESVYSEKKIAFYDIEIFPNLAVVCYKVEGGVVGNAGKDEVVTLINPTANEISELVDTYNLIGFNNFAYDDRLLYAMILGYSNERLFQISQAIIVHGERVFQNNHIGYADIRDFASNKQSLKKYEIEIGNAQPELDLQHQELGLPWEEPVDKSKWDLVASYCANDVVATEATFYYLKADWTARKMLAEIADMPVSTSTNNLTAQIIFGNVRNPKLMYTNLKTGERS
jgi:phage/plasmid-associated DNA primase